MATFTLSGKHLDFNTLTKVFQEKQTLELADEVAGSRQPAPADLQLPALERSRAYLEAQVVTYGPETEEKITRLALLLLIHSQLQQDGPAAAKSTLQRLLAYYNREVYPLVFRFGSDTPRLAQLCQPLLLSGRVRFQGYPLKAAEVAEMFSWQALPLPASEVQALLARPVFSWAQTADLLMTLQPLVNWYIYFDAVFSQVLPDSNTELHLSLRELIKYLKEGQQALEQEINGAAPTLSLHTALANLALTLQEAISNLVKLNQVLLAGLESMVEPPATTTFALTQQINQLIGLQAPKPVIATQETFSTLLIQDTLSRLMAPAQTLVALVFRSFLQADAISGDFLESSTLRVYQQAGLFVPEETVNDQLEKIADFIKTHIPVGAA
jgi:hypothetical protein